MQIIEDPCVEPSIIAPSSVGPTPSLNAINALKLLVILTAGLTDELMDQQRYNVFETRDVELTRKPPNSSREGAALAPDSIPDAIFGRLMPVMIRGLIRADVDPYADYLPRVVSRSDLISRGPAGPGETEKQRKLKTNWRAVSPKP